MQEPCGWYIFAPGRPSLKRTQKTHLKKNGSLSFIIDLLKQFAWVESPIHLLVSVQRSMTNLTWKLGQKSCSCNALNFHLPTFSVERYEICQLVLLVSIFEFLVTGCSALVKQCFHTSQLRADRAILYDHGGNLYLILDGRFVLGRSWLNRVDRGQQ